MPGSPRSGRNIAQVGIAAYANSAHYHQVAKENGINVITMDRVYEKGIDACLNGVFHSLPQNLEAVYFDLDVDVLDRSFAPACPGARPGGLTPAQVRRAAYWMGTKPQVVGMDLVEIDPENDIHDTTCLSAGTFLLSFAAGLLNRS